MGVAVGKWDTLAFAHACWVLSAKLIFQIGHSDLAVHCRRLKQFAPSAGVDMRHRETEQCPGKSCHVGRWKKRWKDESLSRSMSCWKLGSQSWPIFSPIKARLPLPGFWILYQHLKFGACDRKTLGQFFIHYWDFIQPQCGHQRECRTLWHFAAAWDSWIACGRNQSLNWTKLAFFGSFY